MKPMQIIAATLLAGASLASTAANHAAAADTPRAATQHEAPQDSALAQGEVRKVDREQGKLTLRHGEIRNLGMPPMTMVFRVADRSLLEQLKPGDRVLFQAEDRNGAYTVTLLKPAS